MFPALGVIAFFGTVAYLLDDAKSSNSTARRNYENTKNDSISKVKNSYYHAQKKEKLDKLFKVKRAKRKIADNIYKELSSVRKSNKKVNKFLKESKEILNSLFEKKRKEKNYYKRLEIQKEINVVVNARKELFKTKDLLKENIETLYKNLKLANKQTRDIQDEINRVLEN